MDNYSHKNQQMSTAVATATLLAMGFFIWALVKKRANALSYVKESINEVLPRSWKEVGRVARLCIYPIESGSGVKLGLARATQYGLVNGWNQDRMFVLVDDQGRALSGRVHRRAVLISSRCVREGILELRARNMQPLRINYFDPRNTTVTVWYKGMYIRGVDLGDQVSEWLTKFLVLKSGKDYQAWGEVRLAYCDPHQKPVLFDEDAPISNETAEEAEYHRGEDGSFKRAMAEECKPDPQIGIDTTDASMISATSLRDLNERLISKGHRPVSYKHFRPNIVISQNKKPYSEDNWRYVKMGDAVFQVVRPSTRCVLSAVNPKTGEPEPHFEPLPTLKEYHAIINETEEDPDIYSLPTFGVLLRLIRPGSISIGDAVHAST